MRYNYDKMNAHSNAIPLNNSSRDNVMLYPNGLLMAKALKVDPMEKDLPLSYTKHYYIGSERVSAKTGTMDWLGYYPSSWLYEEMPALNIDVQTESSQKFNNAATQVSDIHQLFGSSLPVLNTTDNFTVIHDDTHDPKKMDVYYFHPDHLGSSSYITNMAGMVSQHMEYLPFGELLVDEHKNSYNSPFKYNGKEFDEETGNYFYGARYYDPKWSIFISVDPLAEQFPSWNSYHYVHQNPINLIDPTGMEAEWIPGTDTEKIDFKIDNETKEIVWTKNTPEKFKAVADELLKTKIGENVLREAIDSPIKMNVEFSEDSKIDKGIATFGTNEAVKLSSDGKSILESTITIYEGTVNELNTKYEDRWSIRLDNDGTTHSGKISKHQNMAGTLGHEFIHSLDKKSSSALFPTKNKNQIEERPRTFSEIFYFQTSNQKIK